MEALYNNKYAFLKEKPKCLFVISVIIIVFLLFIICLSLKVEVYDHYVTKGFVECSDNCKIIVAIPTEITVQKIKYNNKFIEPKILSKTLEIDQENVVSYYIYAFNNDYGLQDKEIVEFNFCYNKQRIIKKFINSIF